MSRLRRTVEWTAARLGKGGQPLRFLVAGGINTVFGLSIYPLLLWSSAYLHRHYMTGLLIAQAVSLCFAFTTYKLTVFKTRGNIAREFGSFASFYLANYAVNWLVLPILVEIGHVPPIVAQLSFAVILAVGSWFWHSRVTFRPARER